MIKEKKEYCFFCSKAFHNIGVGFGGFLAGVAAILAIEKSDIIGTKISELQSSITKIDNGIIILKQIICRIDKKLDDLKIADAQNIVKKLNDKSSPLDTINQYNQSGAYFRIPESSIPQAEAVLKSKKPSSEIINELKTYMMIAPAPNGMSSSGKRSADPGGIQFK